MSTLLSRLITVIILVPIITLIILFAPLWLFEAVLAIILGLGVWEWNRLIGIKNIYYHWLYFIVLLALMIVCYWMPHIPFLIVASLFWLAMVYFIFSYQNWPKFWGTSIYLRSALGLVVFIPTWVAISFLHQKPYWLFYILITVWVADSAAYIAGKSLGKHKLVPAISPGKTREGLYGAFAAVITLSVLMSWYMDFSLIKSIMLIIVTIVVTLFSVVGDLFESMIKRYHGVKDSGQLLPGHGGMLDRIDSILAALPVFTLLLLLTKLF